MKTLMCFLIFVTSCIREGSINHRIVVVDNSNNVEVESLDKEQIEKDVKAVFLNKCFVCHYHEQNWGDGVNNTFSLERLKDLPGYFVPAQPDSSSLYNSVLGENGINLMPKNQAKLPESEIKLIRDWILIDASKDKNEKVYYKPQVEEIFQAKCFHCHESGFIESQSDLGRVGGADPMFNNYESVFRFMTPGSIQDSALYERIYYKDGTHLDGSEYGGLTFKELTEIELSLVEEWINQGGNLEGE